MIVTAIAMSFDGRSPPVQSSQCLVFGVRGDRSFILGDRSSETRKGDRYEFLWGEILPPYSGDVKIQDSNSNG
ncbi:hypothetical protein [Microcoleus sp. B9-D4]|uniref:hypothetical protein n=1 Tax=Microcoleus sp. B9-D4 TaxID=2818711 RepID=UPI002FD1FA70